MTKQISLLTKLRTIIMKKKNQQYINENLRTLRLLRSYLIAELKKHLFKKSKI